MALQGPVCHKVDGFWQLILSAWMYSDSAGLMLFDLITIQPYSFVGLKSCLSLWKSAKSRLIISPQGFHVLSRWLQPQRAEFGLFV